MLLRLPRSTHVRRRRHTALYISCSTDDEATAAATRLHYIDDIDRSTSSNRLKLDADEAQFVWLGSPQQL